MARRGLDLDGLLDVVEGLVEPVLEDVQPGQVGVGELPGLDSRRSSRAVLNSVSAWSRRPISW